MKKKMTKLNCVSCGKEALNKDEIGICKKLLGEFSENYYCLDCLADYLSVSVEEIIEKIEEFKAEGCTLFD